MQGSPWTGSSNIIRARVRGHTEPKRRFSQIRPDFCRFLPFPRQQKLSAAPQQSEICVKFSIFHTVFDVKFSVAHPNPGKRSVENFTKISRQISRHLWQRKTEKMFTSALLQGSCSDRNADVLMPRHPTRQKTGASQKTDRSKKGPPRGPSPWGGSGGPLRDWFWRGSGPWVTFFEGVLGDLRGSGEGVGGGPLRLVFGAGLFFGA